MATTSCNLGTVDVNWLKAMNADHPFIAFLFVRESNGRMVQISDRSFVKHGFFALSNSQCTPCQHPSPAGTWLGVGCSDTYGTSNNGDAFWLGPPDEVDPWYGLWSPNCSYFDTGDPQVGGAGNCDGVRSLTQTQVNAFPVLKNRVNLPDGELNVAGANFYYQGYYVIRGEAESKRTNNLSSAKFSATWAGSAWAINQTGGGAAGSVLTRWTGATVDSASNGIDDGRVYLAHKVTGPVAGIYHYEYAIQNRDNARGIAAIRIPCNPIASITNVGFDDIDAAPANDWTYTRLSNEIQFSTAANPLEWNTLYNFWFDSDALPAAVTGQLDEFLAGSGAPTFAIATEGPAGTNCTGNPSSFCSSKFNSAGCVPYMDFTGFPSATAGSGFLVRCLDSLNNKSGLLFYGVSGQASIPFQGGTLCVAAPIKRTPAVNSGGNPPPNDCSGIYSIDMNAFAVGGLGGTPLPALTVPGTVVDCQWWGRDPGYAAPLNTSLSNGLEYTVCN
jgi:hypothetical protein